MREDSVSEQQAAGDMAKAALATPPAQGVEPGVFVVDAAIQDVSDEAVSLTVKRLRESGLPNVAQIMLTLSALLNGARTALTTLPAPSVPWQEQAAQQCEAWAKSHRSTDMELFCRIFADDFRALARSEKGEGK